MMRLYAPYFRVRGSKRWTRVKECSAFPKPNAVRVYQNLLLAPFMYPCLLQYHGIPDNAEISLRPITKGKSL